MKGKKFLWSFLTVIMLLSMTVGAVLADDGVMFRKNISKTPDQETERANINHMAFYVPAQKSDGTLLTEGIEYYLASEEDGGESTLYDTRLYAKPLVSVYIDSLPEEETKSGAGFGAHDAYAAVSLDDGASWKRTNLSNSAHLSSFTLGKDYGYEPYPGDAHNMTFAIAGDKVLVGWISKYCDGGSPLYTFADEDVLALQEAFGLPDLYVRDIWGVAGAQGSVDYQKLGFPEVGEIPYSCVWSARGQLLPVELDDTGTMGYDIIWTKAERMTSGRRDANRLEMNADSAAGFMMTWQEDPEGLRPGQGLGPGEGWSGAVVNQQTDLWYSFVSIEDFVMVMSDDTDTATAVDIAEYIGETIPKVAVPMAMPIRLTDNKMCKEEGSDPYCYVDFNTDEVDGVVNPYLNTDLPDDLSTIVKSESSTFCTSIVPWDTPSGDNTLDLCQTEDLRVLGGRVGASRPRVNVQPYNSLFVVDDTDDTTWYDSGIVIMGAEESKALGEGAVDDTDGDEIIEPEDVGKNMWYYSFDLRYPEFVLQGGMLNQPAKDPSTKDFFELLVDDFGNYFYETEISRRFSHMSQPIHQMGPSGLSSTLIVKQGILNQGGPADIFLRLTKADTSLLFDCELDGDDTTAEQCLPEGYNPYAYEAMECVNLDGTSGWVYLPEDEDETRDGVVGANPRYVEGLCISDMINVSGTTIVACDGEAGDCADDFPWDGVLDGATFPKVTEWVQAGPDYGEDLTDETIGNLRDQSWVNPYDVAKGHRGFIDGDFIMMMYAWSPNWQANSVGNDHYNLYARRSFDGGKSWTTLPENWIDEDSLPEGVSVVADGTNTCENYKNGTTITTICTDYAAGEFEQARNLSQLIGNKVTILDPRYTPTGGLKMLPITDLKEIGFTGYDDDLLRDPSKFFIVYETGDNTTVAEGEAVPLDLFYSRATNFGDDYFLIEYNSSTEDDVVLGFDWLEHDQEDLSGEAANTCNNGGTYYYVIWNQWQEDEFENVSASDAIFRRVMFIPDDEVTSSDYLPIASLLQSSQEVYTTVEDEVISLYISARDLDKLGEGIVEYEWLINGQPFTYTDEDTNCYQESQCKAPARVISGAWDGYNFKDPGEQTGQEFYGWYQFEVRAKDNEGHWTKVLQTKKYIAASLVDLKAYGIFMPLMTR